MRKIWIIGIILFITIIGSASVYDALNPNPYRIRSFTIGDGTNSSLAGTTLGNGTFWGKVIPTNFLAGPNINISQNGTNITITGAATWTLSVINSSEINVDNVYVSGAVVNPPDEAYEMGWQHTVNSFWMYLYKKADEKLSSVVYTENLIYFYNCYYASVDCYTHELEIADNSVSVHGNFFVNDKNIETELIKTSVKAFQADFGNSSQILEDVVLIPQDLKLTNITFKVNNSGYPFILNFSVESYIYGNFIKIANFTVNQTKVYFDELDYDFNNNGEMKLNYTYISNISDSNSLFKFKVR